MMRSLCVFCGSSRGNDPAHAQAARALGRVLAEEGIRLVYGGGNVGLMGVLARACLDAGGEVVGVIPRALVEKEVVLREVTRLLITDGMAERKLEMARLADAFVSLPGGLGTFDELFEMLTWTQLGLQDKASAVLNVNGYFDPMLAQLQQAVEQGFVHPDFAGLLLECHSVDRLLPALRVWRRPKADKAQLALREHAALNPDS